MHQVGSTLIHEVKHAEKFQREREAGGISFTAEELSSKQNFVNAVVDKSLEAEVDAYLFTHEELLKAFGDCAGLYKDEMRELFPIDAQTGRPKDNPKTKRPYTKEEMREKVKEWVRQTVPSSTSSDTYQQGFEKQGAALFDEVFPDRKNEPWTPTPPRREPAGPTAGPPAPPK